MRRILLSVLLCDAPDALSTAIMYRMDGDGKNMRPLSNSSASEFSPGMLEDGRIIYTRWEYVDKGQLGVKCLWAMHPDGSQSSEIYGNDIRFPAYIQPILDKHCVSCHGGTRPKGKLDLRGTPVGLFSVSRNNLIRRKAAPTYRESSDWDGTEYAGPKSIGSHKSPPIAVLRGGKQHKGVKLSEAAFVRLVTWIDASGVFYGSYRGRRDVRHGDHPNFRPVPTFDEAIGTVCPTPMGER